MLTFMTRLHIPLAVFLVLLVKLRNVQCYRDGFNMYKDLLLRGKVDGVDDASEQLEVGKVPNIPKLYYYRTPVLAAHTNDLDNLIGQEPLDGTIQSDIAEPNNDDSSKSSILRDRFLMPRTIVKRDVGRRYTYTGASSRSGDYQDAAVLDKRGPGSILTWALSAKRPLLQSDTSSQGLSRHGPE